MKGKRNVRVSDYLLTGKSHGKRATEVMNEMGITRRTMREMVVNEMTKDGEFIINLQDGNGYFIPDLDTEEGLKDAQTYIKQERARAFALLKKIRRLEGAVMFVTGESFWKSARLQKGLTRYDVILKTHIDSAELSKIENKKIEPTVEQEERLRKLYFEED